MLKKILGCFVVLFSLCFNLWATPLKLYLNEDAVISLIVFKNGNTLNSRFGKTYLRIYDKKDNIDEIFDFSQMEARDGFSFVWNMVFKKNTAYITHTRFFPFILYEKENKNRDWQEIVLDLTYCQKANIYSRVRNLINTRQLSYEYDFVMKNGSSRIYDIVIPELYHLNVFTGNLNAFSYLYHIFEDNPFVMSMSYLMMGFRADSHFSDNIGLIVPGYLPYIIESTPVDYNNPLNHVPLIVIASIIFSFTVFEIFYVKKSNIMFQLEKSVITFDMILLFVSGLIGILIVYFDLFSNQYILTCNFNFIWLFPLNVIASFFLFTEKYKKIFRTYWTIATVLILVSFGIYECWPECFVLTNFLIKTIVFIRVCYTSYRLWLK